MGVLTSCCSGSSCLSYFRGCRAHCCTGRVLHGWLINFPRGRRQADSRCDGPCIIKSPIVCKGTITNGLGAYVYLAKIGYMHHKKCKCSCGHVDVGKSHPNNPTIDRLNPPTKVLTPPNVSRLDRLVNLAHRRHRLSPCLSTLTVALPAVSLALRSKLGSHSGKSLHQPQHPVEALGRDSSWCNKERISLREQQLTRRTRHEPTENCPKRSRDG